MSKLLEDILAKENLELAYQRVMRNKGTKGVDGMTLEQLKPYLEEHNEEILAKVRQRKYKPKPVRRVEIPKGDGSKRNLGIPTVVNDNIKM